MKACTQCKLIVEEGKLCPTCNIELSERFSGMVIVLDPNNSVIAKKINQLTVGKYAIKVR